MKRKEVEPGSGEIGRECGRRLKEEKGGCLLWLYGGRRVKVGVAVEVSGVVEGE